jgi:hypothetical protein
MKDLDRALADISEIRSALARGTAFRGYGPATLAATGALAVACAFVQAHWFAQPAHHVFTYLKLWIGVASLSVLVVGLETVTRSLRVHSDLAQEMIVSAAEHFLPAAVTGALLTVVLIRVAPESLWMLPGLWQLIFGLGVFASCRFLPKLMPAVGIWYVASGLACLLFARGEWAFAPAAMGAPFGIGQLLAAALLFKGEGVRDVGT